MSPFIRRVLLLVLPGGAAEVIRFLLRRRSIDVPVMPPPHEVELVTEAAQPPDLAPPEWEMVCDTDEVWIAHAGWAHQSIVRTQLAKWQDFKCAVAEPGPLGRSHEASPGSPLDVATHNTIMSFGYALGRVAQGRSQVSILDWGGGLGHYYVYARALFPALSLDFTVKDLPGLCAAGASLLPEAHFVSDDDEALSRCYDFVFASSSLHYARSPYALLRRLCESTREWLMITRTPVLEHSDDFVVVQRPYMYGYLTEYPGWFMNRSRLLAAAQDAGFSLERQFLVAERPNVPNATEQAHYYGFLFRRGHPPAPAPSGTGRADVGRPPRR